MRPGRSRCGCRAAFLPFFLDDISYDYDYSCYPNCQHRTKKFGCRNTHIYHYCNYPNPQLQLNHKVNNSYPNLNPYSNFNNTTTRNDR